MFVTAAALLLPSQPACLPAWMQHSLKINSVMLFKLLLPSLPACLDATQFEKQ
jgi:hypothetical protein